MPKHKKTRQQKIIADKRRETASMHTYSLPEEVVQKEIKQPLIATTKPKSVTAISYDYLAKDLRKTAIFTGSIVLLELVLKILTRS